MIAPDAPAVTTATTDAAAVPVLSPELLAFWEEYHICTLTTLRPNGTPHVVPVGATYDPVTGIARVITSSGSRKARNVLAAGRRAPGSRSARWTAPGGRPWKAGPWCARTPSRSPMPRRVTHSATALRAPTRSGW